MALQFHHLDDETRALMVSEIDRDLAERGLYVSNYLNAHGVERWPHLLREAAAQGTDNTLSAALELNRCFKIQVERRKPKGGFTLVAVPVTAAITLAESQFNMYYMRALALRAINGGGGLLVYRAKAVDNPRPESQNMIGKVLDPEIVLRVLRETKGVEPSIGIPMPNSGLCVRLA